MDAVKFLKEIERMCDSYMNNPYSRGDCDECPFSLNKDTCLVGDMCHEPEKAVEIIEQWSKEHPRKTYKDDFIEKFPDAKSFDDDVPMIHWCNIYNKGNCKYGQGDGLRMCVECWGEEMNEDE